MHYDTTFIIPAQAGIQGLTPSSGLAMDPRLRGGDGLTY
jgi:hypothetical protein